MSAEQSAPFWMFTDVPLASLLAQPGGMVFREHLVGRENSFGAKFLLDQPVTQTVERAAAKVRLEGKFAADALAHVIGRLVRVSEHEDAGSEQAFGFDEMSDSLRQRFRLARAGPRQNQQPPAFTGDRLHLARVQFHGHVVVRRTFSAMPFECGRRIRSTRSTRDSCFSAARARTVHPRQAD